MLKSIALLMHIFKSYWSDCSVAASVLERFTILQALMLVDVYNTRILGWEPVLEPWDMQLETVLGPSHAGDAPHAPRHQLSASLLSSAPMQLTASFALSDAAAHALRIKATAQAVLEGTASLSQALEAEHVGDASAGVCCNVVNAAGTRVTVWLAAGGSTTDAKSKLPCLSTA